MLALFRVFQVDSSLGSGNNQGIHVLRALGADMERPSVRFSKYNTKEEIDYTVQKLAELFAVKEKVEGAGKTR